METIFSFAKENFQLINLLVSVLGVVVAGITVVHEVNKRKRNKQQEETQNSNNND